MDIERKSTISSSKETFIKAFEKEIRDNNVEKAALIQQSIYSKIVHHELPESVMDEMKIPRQIDYGNLLVHQAAFEHFLHPTEITETYKEFQELDIILPNNKKVKYNLVAIKFRVWLSGLEEVDPFAFEKEISSLKNVRVQSKLIKRMMINYKIIMSDYYYMIGDYEKKDQNLSYIKKNYRYVSLNDQDLLSLAQYFASHAKFDWASALLVPHVRKIDVDEDLLFYYINLTIADDNMMKKQSYNNILLNAISVNRERYCKMFDSIEKGGASFQLLMNDKLKDLYCQDCQGKIM